MKMLKVSQCKKNLDFKPQIPWPENLPAYAWGDELLCAFSADSAQFAIDLKVPGLSVGLILSEIYKNLSLAELSRILQIKMANSNFEEEDLEILLEKNSLRPSESLFDLLFKLSKTPIEFQNWTSDRKLGAKELFVLKALGEVHSVDTLLSKLALMEPSRQLGIQILENAVELFMMSHDLLSLLPDVDETCEAWSLRLEKIRHPMLTAKAEAKQTTLAELSWPKYISARVIQNQASLVNEVRLQYRNLGEFKRNVEALQKVQLEIEKTSSEAKFQ